MENMKTIELEEIVRSTLVDFFENIENIGCPENEHVDKWFLAMTPKDQRAVVEKFLDLIEGE